MGFSASKIDQKGKLSVMLSPKMSRKIICGQEGGDLISFIINSCLCVNLVSMKGLMRKSLQCVAETMKEAHGF